MINEKKIPDEIQPAKPNWRRRLLISALKSPISTILILAFLYFAFQAYVLQLSPTSGFLIFVPKEDTVSLDMSVEEGIKFVISGGLVSPEMAGKKRRKIK